MIVPFGRTNDLKSIGENFIVFGLIFLKLWRFEVHESTHESTHGTMSWMARKNSHGTLDFWLGTTCESTHESTHKAWVDSWVDPCWFEPRISRNAFSGFCNRGRLMSRPLKHESTHESTPATGNVSNGYFFAHFNCHLCFLKIL